MAFSIEAALPPLIRRDVEYAEHHYPPIPETMPAAVAADPGWSRQWTNIRNSIEQGQDAPRKTKDPARRQLVAKYLAGMGHMELQLIVQGCAYAATQYDMPAAWRTCLLKQAYDDMQHAAGFITRGSRMANEDYWQGTDAPYLWPVNAYQPILRRDLGGFFSAIGLHTEAYPAWTNLSGGGPIADLSVGAWSLQEIEDEAWHLTFLFPAIKEYLHTGTPEEQDRRKRQMVADNEILLEAAVQPAYKNAKEFVVGRLGQDPAVLYGYEHLDERTRYIFGAIGIEESYWPAYLKQGL